MVEGGCLCGAVRYTAPDAPEWTALCHCESCRRACSAPIVAWMGYADAAVTWNGDRSFFNSSDIAKRGFCPKCGTQMSFESKRWPDEIHLYAVTLHDPSKYTPQLHCHHGEHLSWLEVKDDLPVWEGTAPGGSPT